ncbi:hypothetical protein AC578_1828 [Pseudocercospora eumusae]|uniref:C2H2-type domain-containing protein n=1 Tax=Pseudocercospora eumusae TaxID=321146 RepID=A0A139HKH2_9PEZI|nr:hypothetical protein AC578_1828 [Pseudocercospora eumusae]
MMTFAHYPAHTMASNDFTLYPYPESWNQEQNYLSSASYADQSYLTTTSFDSFSTQQSFAPVPEQYNYSANQAISQSKPSPYHSPANSAFEYQQPPQLSSTSDSGASVQSTISSAIGSPSAQAQSNEWSHHQSMDLFPEIVQQHDGNIFATTGFEYASIPVTDKGCVDPSLIQPFSPTQYNGAQFSEVQGRVHSPQPLPYSASPLPTKTSLHSDRSQSSKPQGSASPYAQPQSWQQPYPQYQTSRRPSMSSVHSRHSQHSLGSDDSNKGLCPIATCGRHVKDLKAHMLTHQNERPEKCPIPTCEYHTKGFARKYDKNRHTLTHYKGTMVCGFCPGSGSSAEKSFNRADVFKRHLTSVHGVEQTPPNARRKSPSTTGKKPFGAAREVSGMCSTCGNTFASAQDFYEHLDDCVLRVVQQADPSEATNEKLLTEISQDKQVQETLEKHMLPTNVDYDAPISFDDDEEEDDEEEEIDDEDANDTTYGSRKAGKGGNKSRNRVASNGAIQKPKKGLTLSKNGVPLAGALTAKGNRRRKNYPLSWGAAPDKMRMKKRVMCVYDGQRRLWKDDMMLDADHEVRIPLGENSRAWVSDLDVQTLRRAEGILNATDEEKGPWIQDEAELQSLMDS